VIFLYLVALLLVVLSLFVINRLLRMPLGRRGKRCVKMRSPAVRWA
jgi:ABC-type branched-subunit amino acid transport system permease subunit